MVGSEGEFFMLGFIAGPGQALHRRVRAVATGMADVMRGVT